MNNFEKILAVYLILLILVNLWKRPSPFVFNPTEDCGTLAKINSTTIALLAVIGFIYLMLSSDVANFLESLFNWLFKK